MHSNKKSVAQPLSSQKLSLIFTIRYQFNFHRMNGDWKISRIERARGIGRIANVSVAAHNYHHIIIIHSINESNKKRRSPFVNTHTHTQRAKERKKAVTVAISTSSQPLLQLWQSTHSLSTIEQHWENEKFEWNDERENATAQRRCMNEWTFVDA